MNLLHDIDPGTKEKMTVIVEIPKDSHNKYEIDKSTGIIALDRVLHSAQTYPFDYGFVPQTLWDDGDALDVILLTTAALYPGIKVVARPVAILPMNDNGESDDKVIAVPIKDPRFEKVQDLADISAHTLKEIVHFLETYKQLENKTVKVEAPKGKADAEAAFERGRKMYEAASAAKKE